MKSKSNGKVKKFLSFVLNKGLLLYGIFVACTLTREGLGIVAFIAAIAWVGSMEFIAPMYMETLKDFGSKLPAWAVQQFYNVLAIVFLMRIGFLGFGTIIIMMCLAVPFLFALQVFSWNVARRNMRTEEGLAE